MDNPINYYNELKKIIAPNLFETKIFPIIIIIIIATSGKKNFES